MQKNLHIIYMGTPDFAVAPLQAILAENYKVSAVVTVPDKPVGRGQQIQMSPVKKFALEKKLPVLQPENLKSPEFIKDLNTYKANLFVVVAFRMLPESVWNMPECGTINLHASLLPQYRGAAPINHAIINGETETGVTTFFIEKEIDTGKIIQREKIEIQKEETAGTLHDKLMILGAKTLVNTLDLIAGDNVNEKEQEAFISDKKALKPAPKIFKQDCLINWDEKSEIVYNKIRGLSPYPCAYTRLKNDEKIKHIKIFKTNYQVLQHNQVAGSIKTDNKNVLAVYTQDGIVNIEELQPESKKKMSASEFLRGFEIKSGEKMH